MFVIAEIEDIVQIRPGNFGLPIEQAVNRELNSIYVGKIIPQVGLGVYINQINAISEEHIMHGEANAFVRVRFTVAVLRPFTNEVISGTIIGQTRDTGILMSLGFYEDVLIAPSQLAQAIYDPRTKTLQRTENRYESKSDKVTSVYSSQDVSEEFRKFAELEGESPTKSSINLCTKFITEKLLSEDLQTIAFWNTYQREWEIYNYLVKTALPIQIASEIKIRVIGLRFSDEEDKKPKLVNGKFANQSEITGYGYKQTLKECVLEWEKELEEDTHDVEATEANNKINTESTTIKNALEKIDAVRTDLLPGFEDRKKQDFAFTNEAKTAENQDNTIDSKATAQTSEAIQQQPSVEDNRVTDQQPTKTLEKVIPTSYDLEELGIDMTEVYPRLVAKRSAYVILGSMNESGLGPVEWWTATIDAEEENDQ